MYKAIIMTVRVNDEDQYGSRSCITCTYEMNAGNMKAALERASKYAFRQLDDECCDYIEYVKVYRMEDEDA